MQRTWKSLVTTPLLLVILSCSKAPLELPSAAQQRGPGTAPVIELQPIEKYTLTSLPEWTVEYADPGDIRYFDLEKLMADFQFTRYEAAEVQNGYRDLTRSLGVNPALSLEAKNAFFEEALNKVQKDHHFENSLNIERITKAKFVVVFDLDDTLYDQYAKNLEDCVEVKYKNSQGRDVQLKLAPGWDALITRIHELGGTSVLFTAFLDHLTRENLDRWMLDGKPILESEKLSGFLSHSHLTMSKRIPKNEKEKIEEQLPRSLRGKDLRIVDESLKKAIIVDNNPTLLFQFKNARVVTPFKAKSVCTPIVPGQKELFENSLKTVQAEIEETVKYVEANTGVGFAEAFLPYTALGGLTAEALETGAKITKEAAREQIRKNPKIVPAHY